MELIKLFVSTDWCLSYQESLFFVAEAITVLQWSRASDHIGRKPVILIGLFGIILSMLAFGLSRTFWTLVLRYCLKKPICGPLLSLNRFLVDV